MSSNKILNETLIISGRDIPLKELLFAKRVLDNYLAIVNETSPSELLAEMSEAIKGVKYFQTQDNPCEARNVVSNMLVDASGAASVEEFKRVASQPRQALHELIQDRAELIQHERSLLSAAGY
ncbi:hypothetical protein [Vibrio sp. SCSIO 43136]|uniref:hypothetical protein n=1 Tax=Vibrio sp. SCSIO 43136 TaxID=2819101 RepID=UPI002074CF06|nr:hypothetical protein [Vibrio sp. SCSIO 43136]USD67290.1 hypothetical protein J4N39_21910 [Vibrio sp. SCSIO 43136]